LIDQIIMPLHRRTVHLQFVGLLLTVGLTELLALRVQSPLWPSSAWAGIVLKAIPVIDAAVRPRVQRTWAMVAWGIHGTAFLGLVILILVTA
jgi:hypothetical protein